MTEPRDPMPGLEHDDVRPLLNRAATAALGRMTVAEFAEEARVAAMNVDVPPRAYEVVRDETGHSRSGACDIADTPEAAEAAKRYLDSITPTATSEPLPPDVEGDELWKQAAEIASRAEPSDTRRLAALVCDVVHRIVHVEHAASVAHGKLRRQVAGHDEATEQLVSWALDHQHELARIGRALGGEGAMAEAMPGRWRRFEDEELAELSIAVDHRANEDNPYVRYETIDRLDSELREEYARRSGMPEEVPVRDSYWRRDARGEDPGKPPPRPPSGRDKELADALLWGDGFEFDLTLGELMKRIRAGGGLGREDPLKKQRG